MLGFVLVIAIVFAILYGALRVILGWALPARALARIDAATISGLLFFMKLCLVIAAGAICYLAWVAFSAPT